MSIWGVYSGLEICMTGIDLCILHRNVVVHEKTDAAMTEIMETDMGQIALLEQLSKLVRDIIKMHPLTYLVDTNKIHIA